MLLHWKTLHPLYSWSGSGTGTVSGILPQNLNLPKLQGVHSSPLSGEIKMHVTLYPLPQTSPWPSG
jgi:hypothetical protein